MSITKVDTNGATPSLAKGLFAGLIGGVIATAAKSVGEKIYPPRIHGEPEPPTVLAEKLVGHPLDQSSGAVANETIHWTFGALAGAMYGAIVEYYPAAAAKEGASFGLVLATLTHQTTLPALGLSGSPANQTNRERTSELSTHVVFGVVTEMVRRSIRKFL